MRGTDSGFIRVNCLSNYHLCPVSLAAAFDIHYHNAAFSGQAYLGMAALPL